MTKTSASLGRAVLVVIGAAIGYLGWRTCEATTQPVCQVCQLPVHPPNWTVATGPSQ